ncbi:hypothetical protein BP5796_09983 [Coleophoma crateriformis]|uniref:Uncharacterized protein n=1 Tax=Coleophoma crateriformis TaxID=565419 RepID=A0A3D8QUC9_9HELO|nr:hypothetical protein BP5796_09983 [Coleophoma crateriformis]
MLPSAIATTSLEAADMNKRGTPGCSNFNCWTQIQKEVTVTIGVLVALGSIIILFWGFCYKSQRQRKIQAGSRDVETGCQHKSDEATTKYSRKERQRRRRKGSKKWNWVWGFILGCLLCQQRKNRKRRHRKSRSRHKGSRHATVSNQTPYPAVHLQPLARTRYFDTPMEHSRAKHKSTVSKEGTTRANARKSAVPEIAVIPPTAPSTPIRPLSAAKPKKANLDDAAAFLRGEDVRMETERYRIRIRDIDGDKEQEERQRKRRSRRYGDQERGRARSPNPRYFTPSPSPPQRHHRSERSKRHKKEKKREESPKKFAKWGTMFVLVAELLICWLEPKEGWAGVAKRREREQSSSRESTRRQRHRVRRNESFDSYDSEEVAYANRLRMVEEGRSDRDGSTRATLGRRRRYHSGR